MAFAPIAFVAPNYRDFKNYWTKPYEPGTPTPKPFALESDGGTQVAKLEINKDGFLESSGGALVIPYIDGSYDMWMFPNEADADANDTSNALRIADDTTGSLTSVGLDLALINDLSQAYEFLTLNDAVIFNAFILGKVAHLAERTTGNGGGGIWDVITTGTTPFVDLPDTFGIIQLTGVTGLSLKLRIGKSINPVQLGAVGNWENTTTLQGIDNHAVLQYCFNLPDPLNIRDIRLPAGLYRISDTLVSTSSMGLYGDNAGFYGDLRRLPKEMGSVILADNECTGNLIEFNGQQEDAGDSARLGGIIERITLIGNFNISGLGDPFYTGGTCQNGFYGSERQGLVLRDSIFMKCLNGIFGDTLPGDTVRNGEWLIDNCQASVNVTNGITGGFNDSVIKGGRCARNGVAGIVAGSADLKVQGVYLDFNADSGIAVRGGGCVVDSCIINLGLNYGISCFGDSGTKLVNNHVSDHVNGPGIVLGSGTSNCALIGNSVVNNSGGAGLELAGDCTDIKADLNHFENNNGGTLKKNSATDSINWGRNNTGDSLDFNVSDWTGFKGVRVADRVVTSTTPATGTGVSFSITFTGALPGMSVYIGSPALPSADVIVSGNVIANDTVAIQMFNFSGAGVDVAGTYKVFLDSTDPA